MQHTEKGFVEAAFRGLPTGNWTATAPEDKRTESYEEARRRCALRAERGSVEGGKAT